jgi:hypothetical protein
MKMKFLRSVKGCSETGGIRNGNIRTELGVPSWSQNTEENGDKWK